MERSIEFIILNEEKKEAFSAEILKLMKLCDDDFVPPLSQRSSTVQSNLKSEKTVCAECGIELYHGEMMKQEILAAISGDELLGFVSFRENMVSDKIPEEYLPNIYLSTLMLSSAARGRGLTGRMYDHLFNTLYPERSIFTRTWSTNFAHIKILGKFGFSEFARIENDRGAGIDTVYYSLIR